MVTYLSLWNDSMNKLILYNLIITTHLKLSLSFHKIFVTSIIIQ